MYAKYFKIGIGRCKTSDTERRLILAERSGQIYDADPPKMLNLTFPYFLLGTAGLIFNANSKLLNQTFS